MVENTVDDYPILKEMDFIEREFEMCLEGMKVEDLFERFNEMMTVLDQNMKTGAKKGMTAVVTMSWLYAIACPLR